MQLGLQNPEGPDPKKLGMALVYEPISNAGPAI